MPIYFAEMNKKVIIQRITGGDKIKKHLENLGFTVGETIQVINKVDDNVIVKIKGVSLGLSHDLAKRILI